MGVNRLKGLHKKTVEGYKEFQPFGTDGLFIDMMDGLNLEEQNIFCGGPSSFSVDANTGNYIQIYKKDNNTTFYYKVVTSYTESTITNTDTITSVLYVMPDDTPIKTKTTTITWDSEGINITSISSVITNN